MPDDKVGSFIKSLSKHNPIKRKRKRSLKHLTAEQRKAHDYKRLRRAVRQWRKTPKGRYLEQRKNAQRRDIPWEFVFETWWQMWQEKWSRRGRGKGRYCMSRIGDVGPYSPSNCRIIKLEVNTAERNRRYHEERNQSKY